MTEEEKSRERQIKADVAAELQVNRKAYAVKYRYALIDTDKRMAEYVFNVIDNPDGHNVNELLKIRRFFQLLDKWDWKPKRVKRKIRLYEKLKFSGHRGGGITSLHRCKCSRWRIYSALPGPTGAG